MRTLCRTDHLLQRKKETHLADKRGNSYGWLLAEFAYRNARHVFLPNCKQGVCIQDIVVSSVLTSLGYECYMSVLKMGQTYEC